MTPEATGIPALDALLVWGGAATVLGAVVTLAWRMVRGAMRFGGRVNDFIDDWAGEDARPGVPARPGVMARLDAFEGRLERVEHELYPNHGSSLRDVVDRVAAVVCPDEEQAR